MDKSRYIFSEFRLNDSTEIVVNKRLYDALSKEKKDIIQKKLENNEECNFVNLLSNNKNIVRYIVNYDINYIKNDIIVFRKLLSSYNHYLYIGNYKKCLELCNIILTNSLFYILEYNKIMSLEICSKCFSLIRRKKKTCYEKVLKLLFFQRSEEYNYVCKCKLNARKI